MDYHKLVRDRIPEIIVQKGSTPHTRIATSDDEFKEVLRKKLHEEVEEFIQNPSVEEAADIVEVLRAFTGVYSFSLENLEEVRYKKAQERGAFEKRIILESTSP